jgi:predicted GNAT superfamily acetyltransferase
MVENLTINRGLSSSRLVATKKRNLPLQFNDLRGEVPQGKGGT